MILPGQLHWYIQGEDEVPELYLDNHMMQTFRNCEQRFVHEFIQGYHPIGNKGRFWFLDFGSVVHKLMEVYYTERLNENSIINSNNATASIAWATNQVIKVWQEYDMQYYMQIKEENCLALQGITGLTRLFTQYINYYNNQSEHFRVIGTELYFGKKKEVPLGEFYFHPIDDYSSITDPAKYTVRVYLAGKIDLLLDNGTYIGPMDHKTSKHFKGKNPTIPYEIHEGMAGYVYAANELLRSLVKSDEEYHTIGRKANAVWINSIQVSPEDDPTKRFKRNPILHTDTMLELYRRRMLRTASKIFQVLNMWDPVLEVDRNTDKCTNWYFRDCIFRGAHRQKSIEDMFKILNTDFERGLIWDPEKRDEKEQTVIPVISVI
jgi:PD-(D/E)XK nuclease superfamily